MTKSDEQMEQEQEHEVEKEKRKTRGKKRIRKKKKRRRSPFCTSATTVSKNGAANNCVAVGRDAASTVSINANHSRHSTDHVCRYRRPTPNMREEADVRD